MRGGGEEEEEEEEAEEGAPEEAAVAAEGGGTFRRSTAQVAPSGAARKRLVSFPGHIGREPRRATASPIGTEEASSVEEEDEAAAAAAATAATAVSTLSGTMTVIGTLASGPLHAAAASGACTSP